VSYDLELWRQRPGSKASRALVYCLLGEDAEVPELEDLDLPELEATLDQVLPGWRGPDPSFTCDFARTHLAFSVAYSAVDAVLPRLFDLARAEGLTLFDPQVETVPSSESRRARRIARVARQRETKDQEGSELASLTARADGGDANAQLRLANKLSEGDGVRKNLRKAVALYRAAAESGFVDAMFNLAACYQYGDGVGRDVREAIRWYEKASEQDRTYSPFALGAIYLGFPPIERDNAKAAAYFREALAHGHPDAAASLELLREPEITFEMRRKAWKFCTPRE